MKLLKQSTVYNLVVLMVDSSDHVTGKTGLTLTITASKDGGAFASITPTVTELSYGMYKLALTSSHTDTVGDLAIHVTGTGADPTDVVVQVRAVTTDDLVRSTTPANTLDVSATGEAGLDFANIKAATGATTLTNITVPTVTSITNDVGITQAGADKVWSSTTRTLSSFGTLVTDIWASATRTLTSFGTLASDVWSSATRSLTDKADFALSSASRGTLVDEVWDEALSGHTTAGTTGKALDTASSSSGATPADIWSYATRALTDKADFALSSASRASIVDEVWDEVLTGATHNIATSAGRRLRQLSANIIYEGTLPSQAGVDSNAVVLDSGASSTDGAYDPAVIVIVNGAGLGQSRLIMQYNGSTKTAIVDRDWKITLNDTSEYVILADPGRESVNEGLAQGGGASTITLNANASSQDDAYIGQVVFLRSGVGADQACRVTDYDGTTKVATVAKPWAVQPTNKTGYVMLPTAVLDTSKLIESIWNNATRTLTSGSSITAEEVWEYGTRELTSGMVASLAVSSTEAASVATGFLDISVYYTFIQTITSTYAGDLSSATKIWFAVKDIDDTDANSLVLAEKTDGLTVVNKSAYATASHGSIVVSGESGAWDVALEIDEAATSLLVGYENDYYHASVKALIGGDAVHIWDGSCRITKGVIRTIA